ncbi:MAG: M20 family metallopeptidase [Solirubrobacterales bacterium]
MSDVELEEAKALLVDLISIYSPSGGEGRIIDRLEDMASNYGLTTRRVPSENGRDSLLLGASKDPVIAIVAHVDTITPTWSGATTAQVDGNVVKGLGAVDDKGGVVACLLAAIRLKESGIDLDSVPAVFAFAVDEETGGSGSRSLAVELAPRFAIALEGTELHPGTVECGDLEAMIHVHGISAHGSRRDLGENAVHAAARMITELSKLGLDSFTHPLLGESEASVNEIATGGGMNVVPDECTYRLGIRMVPGQDLRTTLRELEDFAAGHGATVQMIEGTAPFELPTDSPLLSGIQGAVSEVCGKPRDPVGVPAWTDAHNFVDFGGSEAIVFGPGRFDTAHTPDEQIDVRSVVECSRVFATLLSAESLEALSAAPPRTDPARYRKNPS